MRRWIVAMAVGLAACGKGEEKPKEKAPVVAETPGDAARPKPLDEWADARFQMVERTVAARGITDERVLAAMKITPRHEFVPPTIRHQAYDDRPIPIYETQDGTPLTISQPYIIAVMTQAARVKAGDRVLEIGTGSGYQAAVLAMMGAKVYTIELEEELARRTKLVLEKNGFKDVMMKTADGYFGWPDAAPFDAILITCATPVIPPPLLAQLKEGGRIVAPVGDDLEQDLMVITKRESLEREVLEGVRFGLMKGEVGKQR